MTGFPAIEETSLGEACVLVTDGTHDTPRRVESGYPLIKAKEIGGGGRIDFGSCDQISDADHLKIIARSKPEYGDTLFAHIGASLGEAAFVNTTREFSIKNVALFKPNAAIINPRYLYYTVISPAFQALAKVTRMGSAQPFLGLAQLRAHRLRHHSDLIVQGRIASILSAYDDLIANCERRIRVLDNMARALYREWFVNFRYPGHEKVPLVESSLGPIPKGWREARAGAFAIETRRAVPKGALRGSEHYVGLEHIPRRSLALDAWDESEDLGSNKLRFERGEILFGKIRPYFHKAAVAPFGGICSADTFVITARDRLLQPFVACLVASDDFVAHASATANGAKMPRANWDVMMDFGVAVPPDALLTTFCLHVEPWLADQRDLVFQSQNLRKSRNLLLPRLLSGQLSVEAPA